MKSLFDLYQLLQRKVIKEKELINKADFKNLKKMLQEKNNLIEEIKKTNQENSVQTEVDSSKKDCTNFKIKHSAKENQSLKELLKTTAELQSQNLKLLSQKKGETKAKILGLYSRQKSIKGYKNLSQQEAKFFDKKS